MKICLRWSPVFLETLERKECRVSPFVLFLPRVNKRRRNFFVSSFLLNFFSSSFFFIFLFLWMKVQSQNDERLIPSHLLTPADRPNLRWVGSILVRPPLVKFGKSLTESG